MLFRLEISPAETAAREQDMDRFATQPFRDASRRVSAVI
jgi:hypothetical protein